MKSRPGHKSRRLWGTKFRSCLGLGSIQRQFYTKDWSNTCCRICSADDTRTATNCRDLTKFKTNVALPIQLSQNSCLTAPNGFDDARGTWLRSTSWGCIWKNRYYLIKPVNKSVDRLAFVPMHHRFRHEKQVLSNAEKPKCNLIWNSQ